MTTQQIIATQVFKASDIDDNFGSGGANVAPDQGETALRELFRDILSRLDQVTLEVSKIAAPAAGVPMDRGTPVRSAAQKLTYLAIVMGQTAFAAGESATVDIKKNGVSILTAPIALAASSASKVTIDASASIIAGTTMMLGDELTADLGYTAGNAPAHPSYAIVAKPS